jgi:hypothetical protein
MGKKEDVLSEGKKGLADHCFKVEPELVVVRRIRAALNGQTK